MTTYYKGKKVAAGFDIDICDIKETPPPASSDGLTVSEHIHELNRHEMNITPIRLFRFLKELVAIATPQGKDVRMAHVMSAKWEANLRLLIEQCGAWGVNPKAYASAQMEMISVLVNKNRYIYDSVLLGGSALKRYRAWARGPEHKHGDANRFAHPLRDAMLPAELEFAEHYLYGKRLQVAKERALEKNHRWTLKIGKNDPWLRLTAISHFLTLRDVTFPNRVILKTRDFKWKDLRRELFPLVVAPLNPSSDA